MLDTHQERAATDDPLAIICGGGSLPFAVADAVARRGRRAVLFPIRGFGDPAAVERYPHHWIALGQFGRMCRLASAERCRDVVFIGNLIRPSLREIRLDWQTIRLMPRVARLYRGGDDRLLFDIGQAAVVASGHVIAVEAAEGTDAMLARVAELRRLGRIRYPVGVGVLVKAPKPGQDRRLDLPSIGPQTVAGVIRAGLAGLAVVAGGTIMAQPDAVVATADRGKIFVIGLPDPQRQ